MRGESTVEIAVQVNGKVKARLKVAADIDAAAAIAAAKADPQLLPLWRASRSSRRSTSRAVWSTWL